MYYIDWLVDRRHCESKWHAQLHEVRERLDGALKQLSDMKELSWISEQPCTGDLRVDKCTCMKCDRVW